MSEAGEMIPAQESEKPDEPKKAEVNKEIDWKTEARKWEQRAKENREKAEKLDELEEASKSELQKAHEKAAKVEAELKSLKQAAQLEKSRAAVSEKTGIPPELIVGATEEEMLSHAEAIAEYARPKSAAKTPKNGSFSVKGDSNISEAKQRLARDLFN